MGLDRQVGAAQRVREWLKPPTCQSSHPCPCGSQSRVQHGLGTWHPRTGVFNHDREVGAVVPPVDVRPLRVRDSVIKLPRVTMHFVPTPLSYLC